MNKEVSNSGRLTSDTHLSKEIATSVNTEAATDTFAMKLLIVQ